MSDALEDRPQGVGLYVHWPYCARICPYCDFNVVRARGREAEGEALGEAILADLEGQSALIGPRPLASIFFGGGTPSLMPPQLAARIVDRAKGLFPGDGGIEVTLEANPTDAETARYAAFAEAGINRLSLGLQSLDDAALKFLGRDHSAAEGVRAVRAGQAVFGRVSIDLIYARPGQTEAAWRGELSRALDLGPEHVSPYQLTIEPETAFGRAYARGALRPPGEDAAADLYEATQAVLEASGFEAYEVSNHARGVAARSAHNLHVWRGGDYLGLGPGAHGRLTMDNVRTATVARRAVADYVAGVSVETPWSERADLDTREAAEERLLLGLRTVEGAPLSLLPDLGLSRDQAPVAELVTEGFLRMTNSRLIATAKARPVLDGVLKALLV